jgi:hypothetical protein
MDSCLHNEIGVYVDKQNISTVSMVGAFTEVLTNSKYTENAKELAEMLKDRPQNARDELVKYIEYSAKHPRLPDFLQLEAVDMPVWKLYSVDVIMFLLTCTLLGLLFTIFTLKLLISVFFARKTKSKKE